MILLTLDDFTGFKFIARNDDDDAILQDYIDRYEAKYIREILGVELGKLFIEDIQGEDSDSAAISDRFQKLLDPFQEQQCKIYESKGMKDALACMIAYDYIARNQGKHSQSGFVANDVETAKVQSFENAAHYAEEKWNDTVIGTICAIQWYCSDFKKEDYPEYMGIVIRVRYAGLM